MINSDYSTPNSIILPDNKRLFSVYVYYRLVLGGLLIILFLSGLGGNFLGTNNPTLFIYTNYLYICICAVSLGLYLLNKLQAQANHILFLLIFDFIALVMLIYTSNNAIGGLGYLLLIPMAVGSTFLRGHTSIALAAFASLLIMSSSVLHYLDNSSHSQSTFASGIAGALLFLTAISFRLLSKKIQSSEYKIRQQVEQTDYLQHLGQRIVETIQSGIVVIDENLETLFINRAASELLSLNRPLKSLQSIEEVYETLLKWQVYKTTPESISVNLGINRDIKVSFTELSDSKVVSLMLFIEDEKDIKQEAQQLKLASLGRLTSSIAHEIRNPLGAISHAGQLLGESKNLHTEDQELLQMIQVNSKRIDQTINNILQFSRRKEAYPEIINLNSWLEQFCNNYQAHTKAHIILNTPTSIIYGKIDPNHLSQIINNLVDNGLRHSAKSQDENIITIEINNDSSISPYINIIDEGEGIGDEHINEVFEPFYTTKTTGSGLGLYLCKELCQANKSSITYFKKDAKQKSCFRLTLSQ